MDDMQLTGYETKVRAEVVKWRAKPPTRGARIFGTVTRIADRPTEWVMDKTVFGRVLQGVMGIAMDAGSWTVPERRILDAYARMGHVAESIEDIRQTVPLEARDRLAARAARSYRAQLATEGGAAGAAGLGGPGAGAAGLVADVTFVTTWACRAAAHHAAIYGYRTETPPERAMAMQVLVGATAPTDSAKQAVLANITKISQQIAQKKTWEALEKSALVKAIKDAAEALGVRLTKAKLGQVVAVVGIVVGAGYNAWYIDKVCEWSSWTYRSHYLEDKAAGFPSRAQGASCAAVGPELEVIVDAEVVELEVGDETLPV